MKPTPSVSTPFVLAALFALTLASPSRAAEPILNYVELEAMAKASINAEVADLNLIVAAMVPPGSPVSDWRGYKRHDLKIFQTFNKPDGLDAEVLYNVCVLTKATVSAITARKITKQNLGVTANINAVNSMRSAMNGKFFRVAEHACLNAKARFIARLSLSAQSGVRLALSDEAVEHIASVVFFPSDYARPTLGKDLLKALPYVINGVFIISRVGSFAGVVINGLWMSLTTITASTFSIKNLLPGPNEIFKQRDITEVDPKDGIHLDLTAEESALLAPKT